MISFIVNFNGEHTIIDRCLSSIKKFYGNNEIIVISDEVTKIKTLEHGGKWTLRYLTRFLESDGSILIKMDPDSLMLRPFNYVPTSDYFGVVLPSHVHGACKGFSRNYVERIVSSGLLLSDEYIDWKYRRDDKGQVSDDLVCMDIARKLNASIVDWSSEVSIFPFKKIFAVTHGHKT